MVDQGAPWLDSIQAEKFDRSLLSSSCEVEWISAHYRANLFPVAPAV